MSRDTIQKFENVKNATMDTVLKIANHFGLLTSITEEIDQSINNQNDISLY